MKWVTYGCFCLHASDMAESPRLRNESAMSGERGDSVPGSRRRGGVNRRDSAAPSYALLN